MSKLKSKEGLKFTDINENKRIAKYASDKHGVSSGIRIYDTKGKKISDVALKPHEIENWLEATKDYVVDDKKSDKKKKPILEKDVKSFAKPTHEKKESYKSLRGAAKQFVDDIHKMSSISVDKLTSKEGEDLQEMLDGIYYNLPVGADPNEKYKSGGDMYSPSEQTDIRKINKVFPHIDPKFSKEQHIVNMANIRDIAASVDLDQYMNVGDDQKLIAKLVEKYYVGVSPKQIRLFKALKTLGINNA